MYQVFFINLVKNLKCTDHWVIKVTGLHLSVYLHCVCTWHFRILQSCTDIFWCMLVFDQCLRTNIFWQINNNSQNMNSARQCGTKSSKSYEISLSFFCLIVAYNLFIWTYRSFTYVIQIFMHLGPCIYLYIYAAPTEG